ncbi:aminopeptidase B [Proteus mirabilis]|uniref:Aminopeptidase B n=1 Tax=Proteus mirabilis TaxID=584 RepID=A0A379GFP1_PROMI|nr:aminopeptidase B [Proteus mirabilis]
MNKQIMPIMLSNEPAAACWGEKALISTNETGMTVHLTEENRLGAIQRGGRKIDGQGIRNVALVGDGWDLERSWAFWLGFRAPKGARSIEWPQLSEADKKELESRIRIVDWVRDTINTPAEELGPEQLAQRTVDLFCGLDKEDISYKITKGADLRDQNYAEFIL